jgi:hypothetical protein
MPLWHPAVLAPVFICLGLVDSACALLAQAHSVTVLAAAVAAAAISAGDHPLLLPQRWLQSVQGADSLLLLWRLLQSTLPGEAHPAWALFLGAGLCCVCD